MKKKKRVDIMNLVVLEKNQIDEVVASLFIDTINNKPNCVLGLATGSSPVGIYKNLVKAYQEKKVSFKDVTTFNLDEYIGLEETHHQSYRYFMNDNLFNHIDIDKNKTHVPNGTNYEYDVENYDKEIENNGGIDLQILGIGSNGHIAFNEPGTPFDSLTHVVDLKESTIKDNSRFFNSIDEVPKKSITMGLTSIIKAKKIVIIITGENKKEVLARLLTGKISEDLPASILHKHPDVTIYADYKAMGK